MTREDARYYLRSSGFSEEQINTIEQAFKKEPCEDAISRQAALRINELHHGEMPNHINHRIWEEIKALPSVESVNPIKTGHWEKKEDRTDWYDAAYKCSCCGRELMTPYDLKDNLYNDYPYCHCGCRMVEPQEREDKE